jgi:hypothetical protein
MTNVKRAVRAAYMLGRSGHPPRQGVFDELIRRASEGDEVVRREIASLKREVAVLRREIEAGRSHKTKVVAMKNPDAS